MILGARCLKTLKLSGSALKGFLNGFIHTYIVSTKVLLARLQYCIVFDIWVSFGVFAHEWPKACFRSQLVHHCSKEAIPHSERLPNTDETFGFTISSMQQHIPASTFVTNLHFQKAIRSGIQPPGTNCNLICHICTKLLA